MASVDGGRAWTTSSHGVDWRLELERDRLLPGRLVRARVTITARNDIQARGLFVTLLGEEHWKYEVTTTDGKNVRTETRTGREELPRVPVRGSGPLALAAGETRSFDLEVPVPALGPATVTADTAGVTWSLETKLDVASGMDPAIDVAVSVLQPSSLLRAGVVRVGQFAHFEAVDAAAGDITGEIELDPVPLVCGSPFRGRLVLRTPSTMRLQEIRAELRVTVTSTVSGGLEETLVPWSAQIVGPGAISGDHEIGFEGQIDDRLLPTIDLPHGRVSSAFHVVLARSMARDPHLVRDVSMATTATD